MQWLTVGMTAITAVILFVFGLQHFSDEVQRITGERFRKALATATRLPIAGVGIGALVTGVIQSSSATSVITISLVNSGVLSFRNSVGIIFGSNIGTTVTAQLVAFKLTAFAPVFIIAGFAMSLLRSRVSVFGKAVFYFGFVFFSLNLISDSLEPLESSDALIDLLTSPQNPLFAIAAGCLFTILVQSSSVTTGLAIVFIQQGLLSLENAVPLIMGANIGTTVTAIIAMFGMDLAARKTGLCHFLFNVGGVLLFTPALLLWGHHLALVTIDPAIALAGIHMIFNVATSLVFLLLFRPFVDLVNRTLGESKMDLTSLQPPAMPSSPTFEEIRADLDRSLDEMFAFLQENYNHVTLSIEANYRGIFDAAEKRIAYVDILRREYLGYFSKAVTAINDESESRQLMAFITRFDYLFQIHDSINDLFNAKRVINEQYIELQSDIILLIREVSGETLGLFDEIRQSREDASIDIQAKARDVQHQIDEANRELLRLMVHPDRRDVGALTNLITYSQRLRDKLVNYAGIREHGPSHSLQHP